MMVLDKEQKKAAAILIVICVLGVLSFFIPTNDTDTKQEDLPPKVEVLYTGLCEGNYGGTVVCGGVKNNSSDMLDVTVYTNVYNDSGVQIQDQVEWIRNIEPGNEAEFKGYPVPREAHETKIVDVKYRKS